MNHALRFPLPTLRFPHLPQLPRLALASLAILLPALGQAQWTAPAGTGDPALAALRPVEVKGQTVRAASAAYSSTSFDQQDVQQRQVSQPQELFREVPGMHVQNYQLSGVADTLVLRGFGGGGHGGDLGVVLDGIPLNEAMSHADGYVDFNVIVPLEIDRLTVFKGPVSALYGNFNRAGLIVVDTRKRGSYKDLDLSLGSHSTLDAQAAFGLRPAQDEQLNLAMQQYRTEGFRAQSALARTTLAARWSKLLSADLEIALSGRLHQGEGDSPAYLAAAQFVADPAGKDPRVMNDGAVKNFATLRADLNYAWSDEVRLLSFAYATRQDFSRWFTRPVNPTRWQQREESYERSVSGAGASLNGRSPPAWGGINWVAGLETFRESTDYQFYDALNFRQRTAPALNQRTSTLNSVSAFGEVEWPLHALFKPSAGLRWDSFSGGCRRNGAETAADPCEAMARTSHASPKLGVRSDWAPGVQLRASWAEGFALPGTFVKYALGAAQLEPNVFRQTEIGAQFKPGGGLLLDLAAYRLVSSQEVRTVAPGVYENYGATRRSGVEASALWSPVVGVDVSLAYGSALSRVTASANPALLGKRVAGVPRYTTTLGLAWRLVPGWTASATWRKVGPYALNADNSAAYEGFQTVDLGLSYEVAGATPYRLYASLANVTDRAYASSASLIGGIPLFAPGAPRSLKLGVQLHF